VPQSSPRPLRASQYASTVPQAVTTMTGMRFGAYPSWPASNKSAFERDGSEAAARVPAGETNARRESTAARGEDTGGLPGSIGVGRPAR
jgi:hypothetical protein